MKIVVLNGSPKGDLSVTLQYALYLQKSFPQVEFEFVNIAQRIKRIEKDPQVFEEIIQQVRTANGVLWAFPLYILMVHAHYKRFIELIFERGAQDAFAGKYAATLSTSIHFFDHTAHIYMQGICDDLGMHFVEAFSADMQDLRKQEGQLQLEIFGRHFLDAIQNRAVTQRRYPPVIWNDFRYQPGPAPAKISGHGKKIVILHDVNEPKGNLAHMVERCQSALEGDVSVFNIHDLDIKGSCLGCLQCGSDQHCAYEGKDGYIDFYRTQVMAADILIYAGSIVDRYLSARWKTFFDRVFFNTHTPVLMNKQAAFVIAGPLGQVPNLTEIMQAFMELQGANLAGFVSDESGSSTDIDRLLDQLMTSVINDSLAAYERPFTFLGIAGLHIFRDDIYGRLRTVFQADHRAYKRLGIYKTFPQRDWKIALLNAFTGVFLRIPPVKKVFKQHIKEGMVQPLQAVVKNHPGPSTAQVQPAGD
jgi:multimeric flavodoxin WrbA